MRIWVIGRNYPMPENQMSGSFELEQAKMLAKRDEVEVSYLATSFHPTKKIKKFGFQHWNEDGVSVFTYSKFFLPRVFPFYFIKIRNSFWRTFLNQVQDKQGLPDVIHLHYPTMLMLADVLEEYQRKGVKIVVTEHWSKVLTKKTDAFETKQLQKYTNMVDSFLCVGPQLKESVLNLTNSNTDVKIIPNVVSSIFNPSTSQHNGFRFVAVGRLVKSKQFDKLIEVFAEHFKGNPDISLSIIGGGAEMANLNQLIASFHMDSQIHMLGQMSKADTAKTVSESDCLVCYSKFETFGVPIIEAWSCGLPAIWTHTCGVLQTSDDRLGIGVPANDKAELYQAMKYMLENRNSYNKNTIREYALSHYAESVIVNELISIYSH